MAVTLQTVLRQYGRREDAPLLRRRISNELRRKRVRMVVIDDDPTGIQTVHGCLLLTEITPARVAEALDDDCPFFYLLVNSRAMTEAEARRVVRQAVEATLEANRERGYNLLFVSRSDSTLRGHFPAESDTIAEVLRKGGFEPLMPTLFVPAFFEAGRMTIDGMHYMQQGEMLVPTCETEFARDNVFAYARSYLPDYIVEKGRGAIQEEAILHLTLETIRTTDLAAQLRDNQAKRFISADAFDYRDLARLAVAVLAQFEAGRKGQCAVIRSSSSFPKALSGIEEQPYVKAEKQNARGVVVVGSHVKKSTEQLEALLTLDGTCGVEIDVERILAKDKSQLPELMARAEELYNKGIVPVLYTSRREVRIDDVAARQALGEQISRFLVEAVRALPFRPDFLISKGGITSHDILTHSLEVKTARVAGQAAAGIPTLQTAADSPFPELLYVIFPGNVGAVESLREVVERIRNRA